MENRRELRFQKYMMSFVPNREDLLKIAAFLVMFGLVFFLGFIFHDLVDDTYMCKYHFKEVMYDVYAIVVGNSSNYTIIDVMNISP